MRDDEPPPPALPRFAWRAVGAVALAQAVLLLALSWRYGFHRDELYFLAAGDRPAWGYVDQPPLTPMLARLSTALFGDNPTGLRVVAALIAAAVVVVAALTARELGGRRSVQVFAAATTALSTFTLVVGHMLSTTSVDLLAWTLVGLLTLRVVRTGDTRWWLAVGAVVGVGMTNKWLVLLVVAALGVALLAVGPRSVLRSGWLAAGAVLAALIALPTVLWQAAHGWPQLSVAGGISGDEGAENRALFVPLQLVYLSPLLVPVWLAGLVRLWGNPAVRWARALGVAYPVLCVLVLAAGGKPYYAIPLLVLLQAAGAEPTVNWLGQGTWQLRTGVAGMAAVFGAAASVVTALPVLPPQYLGPVLAMNRELGEEVGWPRFVDTVAAGWQQLTPQERATAVIFTRNYGQAGAIERYGPDRGLPGPYSGHMSYADWGPPPDRLTGPVLVVGPPGEASGRVFTGCRLLTRHDNGFGLENEEQGTPVSRCSLARPWSEVWPSLRRFS